MRTYLSYPILCGVFLAASQHGAVCAEEQPTATGAPLDRVGVALGSHC